MTMEGHCIRCYHVHGKKEGVDVGSHQTGGCEGIKDRLKRCLFLYIQESPDVKFKDIRGRREKVRDFFYGMYSNIDSWEREMIQMINYIERRQIK